MGEYNSTTPPAPSTEHREWSPDDEITTDEIENTFERCPDCGAYAIRITDSHYCETNSETTLTDTERHQRIAADPYPPAETVAIVDQPTGKAFAYHELDADNEPLCTVQTDNPLAYHTRGDVQDDQHAPCQICQRIRQKREADR